MYESVMNIKDIRFCATGYDPANPLFLLTESTDSFKCRRKIPIFCENVFTKMGNFFHTRVEPNDKGDHKLLQTRLICANR
jgi:hypothetical protein